MIANSAIYLDGRPAAEQPRSLRETYEAWRRGDGVAWVDLCDPSKGEISSVADGFGLHGLAVEDATEAHQRPKLERYDDTIFVVLKPARYKDGPEEVDFGESHVFAGERFVVTIRRGDFPALEEVRRRAEAEPELLRLGPVAVLHAILDLVVDGYGPVVDGIENDTEEIEAQVFGGDPAVSRRIYDLSQEVVQFQRATVPLARALEELVEDDSIAPELRRRLRDVHDHALRVTERIGGFRNLLSDILSVNLTLVSVRQNDQTKRISAWAAILAVPTVVTGIYGMNFEHMPELSWPFGYPLALAVMALICVALYVVFKRAEWL